ncbi:diacylglycerol kinase-like protein [Streptomyces sp. TLI_235]|nr:acylglycerol kinase family protein [Streptomyces sp. TLI_235]PBC78457.1 diacylglycerol kinase-like protein [Streptomyces sp. TLI_235]
MSSLSTPASRPDGRGAAEPLLVLVDPAAGRADGESVRIARDVLCGGADAKVALPESPSELDRVLSHRGRRRPVVIGSDQAVQKVLQALHRQRDLGTDPVGVVPVGPAASVLACRSLGVPEQPVAAARAVLGGAPRKLDLVVDDGGGVVLAELRIGAEPRRGLPSLRSLWAKRAAPDQATVPDPEATPMRVEADGRLLVDVHERIRQLHVRPVGGELELVIRTGAAERRLRASALSVAGRGFGYTADGCPVGPVRHRTWTVHPGAWALLLPAG